MSDPGLQSERTYLAWQRTGLSFAAAGALCTGATGGVDNMIARMPGIVGLAAGALILVCALVRYRQVAAAAAQERATPAPVVMVAVAAAATVTALGALVLALAGISA